MQQKSELPEGWSSENIGNICKFIDYRGKTPKKASSGIRLITAKNVRMGYLSEFPLEYISCEEYQNWMTRGFPKYGDILLTTEGPLGNIAELEIKERIALAQRVINLSPHSPILPKFIKYLLMSPEVQYSIHQRSTGTTVKGIKSSNLKMIQVPICPLPEQHRIVSAIEALFARLDATNEKLDRVPEIMKKFRESVLAAACEGRLVPTEVNIARKEGRDYESADLLLKRILNERTEKLHINNKQQYEEPQEPDVSTLRELPDGWIWTSLNQLLVDISAGKSFRCEERPPNENEVGVVKVSSVTWGEFDEKESKTCTNPNNVREEYYIREGDFLFSRANTIELVGACVIVKQISKKLMLSDKILRFNLAIVPAEWILINLRSFYGRSEIEHLATGNQKSMRNIGQDRIRQIRIPLPPLSEQYEIIRCVDALFAFADSIEAKVAVAREKTEKLRQSILAKAFNGELVPTEAELARKEGRNYESAEALLERIMNEKSGKKR